MMHVKYQFRKPKGLIIPKGPNFARAKTICSDIDGTIIRFKAPKHRPRRWGDPVFPERMYHLDDMYFRSMYSEGFNVSDNWDRFGFFQHAWAFYGPWFTGPLAELEMYFSLVKPVRYENNDFSLFHPRAFEDKVGDYLTNSYSKFKNDVGDHIGRHDYIAPVNWQPLQGFPTVAVKLEVIPDLTVNRGDVRYLVFFPISDKIMAYINFWPSQFLALPQAELDKRVDRSTMLELMENIINSIEVTLSPDAQAQQKAALAGLDDVSLIKDFPPLKWDESDANLSSKELPAK